MNATRRAVLTQQLNNPEGTKLDELIARANENKTSVLQELQVESPVPDNDDDSKSAAADYLFNSGVYLTDNPALGIRASTWSEISQKPPPVQYVFACHMKNKVTRVALDLKQRIKAFRLMRRQIALARTYGASDRGSPNRMFWDTEVMNSESALEYPPSEYIIGDVRFTTSDAIRIIESKPISKAQVLRDYAEGTEVYVAQLDYAKTDAEMKDVASGIEYSHKQDIAGNLTAELIEEYLMEQAAEVINKRTKEGIVDIATKAKATDISVYEFTQSNTDEDILKAIIATPKRFRYTTVLGLEDSIVEWLGIDRSSFYAGSNINLPAGAAAGTDMYVRAPEMRMCIDVPADYGLAAKELLFLDADHSLCLFILEGSELETREFINRKRMNEIIWSGTMGTSEKYPTQKDQTLRPYRMFKLDTP